MITLLTDFGLSDPYAGIMKGVILSINPEARIVDITHGVEPRDITAGAYLLAAAYPYFPKGSIHLAVVDPGVGGSRFIIAVRADGHYFLAPDNGILSLILDAGRVDSIVCVKNQDYFLSPVSRTFHGRDIFAPVAAHLSRGVDIRDLGPAVKQEAVVNLKIRRPFVPESGEIVGCIIMIDRFGNLITNIDEDCIKQLSDMKKAPSFKVIIGDHQIDGLAACYQDRAPKTLMAVFGSMGLLEISVNCGSAARHCHASKGDPVRVMLR